MPDHFTSNRAPIDSREIFFYCSGEQCLAAHRRAVGFIDWLDEVGRITGEVVGLDADVE
jgi:hypothetical protein